MPTIATWNINSIRARLANVTDWLAQVQPDVVLLQEIKCQSQDFPALDLQAAGYHCLVLGQKSYNGVAILSRHPIEPILMGLPGDDGDEQARYLEAQILGLRVACLYLPNGNPAPGEKFDYKLAWMRRLIDRCKQLLAQDVPFLLGGDFNICPNDGDVYDPKGWADDALCHPKSRALFREMLYLGLTEAMDALHPGPGNYTFWDYQAGAWPRNLGLRIDHFLLSPRLADRLDQCHVDKDPRSRDKASDHTPVILSLRD